MKEYIKMVDNEDATEKRQAFWKKLTLPTLKAIMGNLEYVLEDSATVDEYAQVIEEEFLIQGLILFMKALPKTSITGMIKDLEIDPKVNRREALTLYIIGKAYPHLNDVADAIPPVIRAVKEVSEEIKNIKPGIKREELKKFTNEELKYFMNENKIKKPKSKKSVKSSYADSIMAYLKKKE
jgi:hypothetical protein